MWSNVIQSIMPPPPPPPPPPPHFSLSLSPFSFFFYISDTVKWALMKEKSIWIDGL